MDKPKSTNLTASPSLLADEARAALLGHSSAVLWFSGLSGSGKSTIARALECRLVEQGILACILDGDNVRMGLNSDLAFSERDREENLRRVAEVAKLMAAAGLLCIVSFISPLKRSRERARQIIQPHEFLEVYVSTPVEECERRDVKGLYQKARAGEIRDFTGVNSPFEPPEQVDIELPTQKLSIDDAVSLCIAVLQQRGIIPTVTQ